MNIILAAGEANRFGSDKLRLVLPDGQTLLQQVCSFVRQGFVLATRVPREEIHCYAQVIPKDTSTICATLLGTLHYWKNTWVRVWLGDVLWALGDVESIHKSPITEIRAWGCTRTPRREVFALEWPASRSQQVAGALMEAHARHVLYGEDVRLQTALRILGCKITQVEGKTRDIDTPEDWL